MDADLRTEQGYSCGTCHVALDVFCLSMIVVLFDTLKLSALAVYLPVVDDIGFLKPQCDDTTSTILVYIVEVGTVYICSSTIRICSFFTSLLWFYSSLALISALCSTPTSGWLVPLSRCC